LLKNDIQKNDRVILLTHHFSIEWLAVDMAIMAVGAISVPVHFPQREEDLKLIFGRMEPALVIHSSSISIQNISFSKKSISFENLLQNIRGVNESEIQQLTNIRNSLSISNIATIVHTSGSSGEPRAVCLSHQNIMSNVMSVLTLVPLHSTNKGDEFSSPEPHF
jgi:long-chain acyl-CoA synthetase